jgi:hypothetical protein
MLPDYLYPFPAGSTLVRGKVIADGSGEPVPGVTINIVEKPIETFSDAGGRFVIYFGPLAEDDIDVQDSHRYVLSNGGVDFTLQLTHADYATKTVPIGTIEEGKSKLVETPISLIPV